jgi:hypothetical protein
MTMQLKSIAALGFAAALTAFATAPASANTDSSNTAFETGEATAARYDAVPSNYCGCRRRYVVRYYTYRYYYRIRYVRYYI